MYPLPDPPDADVTKILPFVLSLHVGLVPLALTDTTVGCVTDTDVLPTSLKESFA